MFIVHVEERLAPSEAGCSIACLELWTLPPLLSKPVIQGAS